MSVTISDVQSLTGYTSSTTEAKTASDELMSEGTFLTLLITQMQNQDPLDPMENQEFLQQLASLSTVEELKLTNENLEVLQLYQSSINNAQSVSLIGKTVKANGDVIKLPDDGEADISFRLGAAAAKVTISIYDSSGDLAGTITKGNLEEGEQTVTWNGRNSDNSPMPAGDYTFEVTATDTSGADVEVQTFLSGIVDSVSFTSGSPQIMINGQAVSLGDIYEVK